MPRADSSKRAPFPALSFASPGRTALKWLVEAIEISREGVALPGGPIALPPSSRPERHPAPTPLYCSTSSLEAIRHLLNSDLIASQSAPNGRLREHPDDPLAHS